MCRSHYEDYKKSCEEIHEKARYRNYPMSFSILSDFQEDDLQEMMDLGVKYSGQGSFAEPAGMVASPIMNNFYVRDMCDNFRNYSISNPVATSWATAAIIAAEAALQQSGNFQPKTSDRPLGRERPETRPRHRQSRCRNHFPAKIRRQLGTARCRNQPQHIPHGRFRSDQKSRRDPVYLRRPRQRGAACGL